MRETAKRTPMLTRWFHGVTLAANVQVQPIAPKPLPLVCPFRGFWFVIRRHYTLCLKHACDTTGCNVIRVFLMPRLIRTASQWDAHRQHCLTAR